MRPSPAPVVRALSSSRQNWVLEREPVGDTTGFKPKLPFLTGTGR